MTSLSVIVFFFLLSFSLLFSNSQHVQFTDKYVNNSAVLNIVYAWMHKHTPQYSDQSLIDIVFSMVSWKPLHLVNPWFPFTAYYIDIQHILYRFSIEPQLLKPKLAFLLFDWQECILCII